MHRLALAILLLAPLVSVAGPMVPAGDLVLRHDIQKLADHGVITGTVSTWPLPWAPILEDLNNADVTILPPTVADSFLRVKQRASWAARTREFTFNTEVGFADNATRIRSFQNTPRGRAEVSAGFSWIDRWFGAEINAQYVDNQKEGDEFRLDDSLLGVVIGNWSIAASTQQRWWGPGWDGSLILSNNARPFPSLTIDRIFNDPFETKWLSWIGSWDFSVMFGQLEKEREIPNAQFFGMRFNFRPMPGLEIGLSRSAQWCGDGRPCDLDTFGRLLIGRDNPGDDDVNDDNEPGNQLAGVDFRWVPGFIEMPVAFYGQFIGEDEAGGLPSQWIGQLGVEWNGVLLDRWSARGFAEVSATTCRFYQSEKNYNCAYNHSLYRTGYRYKGRSIGDGSDNDAELFSTGLILVDSADIQWRALLRFGELNTADLPDIYNSLTATPQDIISLDLSHSRGFAFGVIDVGAGYESVDDELTGSTSSDTRLYIQWRSSY